jgi:hypothetical protein
VTGVFGAYWGLTGVILLLGSAVYRLTSIGLEAFSYAFRWYHWVSLTLVVLFMAYAEGYRGFQQRFSPRVAARARFLKGDANVLRALLAPFFCMGYFHATKRRKVTSLSLTIGIIILVLLVRLLPQPWRGIVDVGVVVGLAWGLVSIFVFSIVAFTREEFHYSPEVPEEEEDQTGTNP